MPWAIACRHADWDGARTYRNLSIIYFNRGQFHISPDRLEMSRKRVFQSQLRRESDGFRQHSSVSGPRFEQFGEVGGSEKNDLSGACRRGSVWNAGHFGCQEATHARWAEPLHVRVGFAVVLDFQLPIVRRGGRQGQAGEGETMPYVKCPSCGERGKIGATLIGARIKCKVCGVSFQVSPPPAKAPVTAGLVSDFPSSAVNAPEGIEVEGLDASTWTLSTETAVSLKAVATAEPEPQTAASRAVVATDSSAEYAANIRCSLPKTNISTVSSIWLVSRKLSTITGARAGPSRACRRRMSRISRAQWKRRSWFCSRRKDAASTGTSPDSR